VGSEPERRRIIVRRRPRGLVAASTLIAAAVVGVGLRRSLMRVRGLSMRPTLREGDLVLTVPLPPVSGDGPLHGAAWETRRRLVRPGVMVVLSEPGARDHLIIKRVTAITPDGVEVVGDDPGWSIDSRTFGSVPHRDVRRIVLGKVPLSPRR
jgi:signal peptidase I